MIEMKMNERILLAIGEKSLQIKNERNLKYYQNQ
jgi:hypothetical protein